MSGRSLLLQHIEQWIADLGPMTGDAIITEAGTDPATIRGLLDEAVTDGRLVEAGGVYSLPAGS